MSKRAIHSLNDTVTELKSGIRIGEFLIYAKKEIAGRFDEEKNVDIFVKWRNVEFKLLVAKIFFGRGYYKPWVELFGISSELNFGNQIFQYFDSDVENRILDLFSRSLGPGENIYVEYEQDKETLYIQQHGLAMPISRLGYKLFKIGFTWFKDWYFPEGYMEGGRKLQGEKPLNQKIKLDHLRQIKKEARESLNKMRNYEPNEYITRAIARAKLILR